MNAFESGERKAIPAVLVYVKNHDRVLMVHRSGSKPGDYHSGKWNGLGGKCEKDESPLDAAVREVFEESTLRLMPSSVKPLGVIHFPNFKAHKNEDWIVYVFVAHYGESAIPRSGPEGDLHWVRSSELLKLNLWAGDRHFIPFVVGEKPFLGAIWYQGQDVVRHWVQGMG